MRLIVVLVVTEAGWMAFDGVRALTVGDYVRPAEGEYAGQLGPWSKVVETVGIDPESTLMKLIFVTYGFAWLLSLIAFIRERPRSWWLILAFAVGSLWYFFIGTGTSVLIIGLLMAPSVRAIGT